MGVSDPDFYQASKFSPDYVEPPRQKGCFFYGCVFSIVLAVLMMIALAVFAFISYRMLSQLIGQYTSETPRPLPKLEMPDAERQKVFDRFDAFRKALREGTPTEPLVLNSDDLNALIERNPDLAGKIYVTIDDDKIKGDVSVPLDFFGLNMMQGRYLNGQAEFKASLRDGILVVRLDDLEVNGKDVPENVMSGLRQQNLAEEMNRNPENAREIHKFESIEIEDGLLTITAKPVEKRVPGEGGGRAKPETGSDTEADSAAPSEEARKPDLKSESGSETRGVNLPDDVLAPPEAPASPPEPSTVPAKPSDPEPEAARGSPPPVLVAAWRSSLLMLQRRQFRGAAGEEPRTLSRIN
jgi:hypothetical protein